MCGPRRSNSLVGEEGVGHSEAGVLVDVGLPVSNPEERGERKRRERGRVVNTGRGARELGAARRSSTETHCFHPREAGKDRQRGQHVQIDESKR